MSYKQLFHKKPTEEIITQILNCFNLKNINDYTEFSILDMRNNNVLQHFENIRNELESYYIPCKKNIYMKEFSLKSIITISRQFLKTKGYTLDSREKFIKSKKYLLYKIISIEEKNDRAKNKIIVSFN